MRRILLSAIAIALVAAIGTVLPVLPASAAGVSVTIAGPAKISSLKVSNWTVQVKPARIAPLTIFLDGTKVLTGASNKSGKYPITWNPNVTGTFKLVAVASKSGGYNAAKSAAFKISVSKLTTKIEPDENGFPDSLDWNGDGTVTAEVTPNIGKYNKSRKVQLEWWKRSTGKWVIDDTASTDIHGKADLTFDTSSELSDGSDACDESNIDSMDGSTFTYRLRALATKLTKEAVSEHYDVNFYCSDGSNGGSSGDSNITADANSSYVDLAYESLSITIEVATESTDYTVTQYYCSADFDDCSDESNWYFSEAQNYNDNESNSFSFFPDVSTGTYELRYVFESFDTNEMVTSNTVTVSVSDSNSDW